MKIKTILGLTIVSLLAALSALARNPPEKSQQDQAKPAGTPTPDLTVFGLHLGQKFTLPECERIVGDPVISGSYVIYKVPESGRCFEWLDVNAIKPNTPVVTDRIRIQFSIKELPQQTFGEMPALVVDGNLEEVTVWTGGLDSQDCWLQQLTVKYGKPTRYEEVSKQNHFGAEFASHTASWRFSNLGIDFNGVATSTDIGDIFILTSKGADFLAADSPRFDHPTEQVGPKL